MNLVRNWTTTMTTAVAGSLHGLAILSTLFRLWYRWSLASIWWDDAWAIIALLADMGILVSVILQQPILETVYLRSNISIAQWISFCAFPLVTWTARLSILTSVMRVSQPEVALKRVAICVGIAFGAMGICSTVQRLEACICFSCRPTISIAVVQTATDGFADVLLAAMPVIYLRNMKLCRESMMLIVCTFFASMVIAIATIIHATVLFKPVALESIILTHVQTALSLLVCNLLVIVSFIYRILHRDNMDLEDSGVAKSRAELTTVELGEAVWTEETCEDVSFSASLASGRTASSTWSFRSPSRPNLSCIITQTTKAEMAPGDIVQEER